MLTIGSDWQIRLNSDHPTAHFAAAELQRTLQRIGAPRLPITTASAAAQISLSHGPDGDGFVYVAGPHGCRIVGAGPRGLLYGVYALLERLGCCWAAPGSGGEYLPDSARLNLPGDGFAERPAIERRLLILGHDTLLDNAADWIRWAARARYSGIFVHTTPGTPALGACRMRNWRRLRAGLLPLLAERGLTLEIGGHHRTDLLPRTALRRDPGMQRHDGRRRRPDVNACLSSPAAQQLLRERAAAFARSEPTATVYHLWPDDRASGGWCRCDACAALSPADQALRFANLVAEGVTSVNPTARTSFLAYHETAESELTLPAHPAVELCFAPRTRNYGCAITAEDPLNVPQYLALQRLTRHVNHHRPLVFEYYSDGLLHKSVLPVFDARLAADAAAYAAAGCDVALLLTGDRRHATPGPTPYQLGRLLWDPALDTATLLADYLAARRPADPAALADAYRAATAVWQVLLQHDPAERPPPIGAIGLNVAADPPRDTLDVYAAPAQLAEQRLRRLDTLSTLITALQPSPAAPDGSGPAAADWAELRALAELWQLLLTRQRLVVLINRRAATHTLHVALTVARAAVNAVRRSHRAGHTSGDQTALFDALHDLQLDALERRMTPVLRRLPIHLRALQRLASALFAVWYPRRGKIG